MAKFSKDSLYASTSSNSPFQRKELDLRKELFGTLHGAADEIPKGRKGLLRKIRTDDEGHPLRCPCRDSITDEPDLDRGPCRFCHSVGWFWDEYKIVYYKNDDVFRTSGGIPKQDASHFYIEYDEDIAPIDIIVEVEVDKEGEITYPIKRKGFYDIRVVEDFRADDGRLEYWRITGGYIRDWSVWYERVRNRQYG